MPQSENTGQVDDLQRPLRTVFVIMPFTRTPERNEDELREFFEEQLKARIENETGFRFSYRVHRSGQAFRITEQIIRDLFRADIVICDLSGESPNPNVMYELGVRLACSRRPVILIREQGTNGGLPFDIRGLHVHDYNPRAYARLYDYIRVKLAAFESGEEIFLSPVFDVLEGEAGFEQIGKAKAIKLVQVLQVGMVSHLASLLRSVNRHLIARSEVQLTENVNLLARELLDKREQLASIDWSEARVVQGPHPSLGYYLATQYLDGLVDDQTGVALSVALLRYYETYFTDLAWWFEVQLAAIIDFAQRTTILAHSCGAVLRMLQSEEGASDYVRAREDLHGMLSTLRSS